MATVHARVPHGVVQRSMIHVRSLGSVMKYDSFAYVALRSVHRPSASLSTGSSRLTAMTTPEQG
jgi:hypothetical protein